jgi:hypothetical protein
MENSANPHYYDPAAVLGSYEDPIVSNQSLQYCTALIWFETVNCVNDVCLYLFASVHFMSTFVRN